MAPDHVRTIPPWVIQRPPQAVPPQHNHAPSETRHGRDPSDTTRDDTFDNEDNDIYHGSNININGNSNGNSSSNGNGNGYDNKSNGSGSRSRSGTANTGSVSRDGPDANGLFTAADGVKEPAAPISAKDEGPRKGVRHRMSHLFLRREGRRWDHLRTAEPVIVPQYHVVTRPAVHERQKPNSPESMPAASVPRIELDGQDAGTTTGSGGPPPHSTSTRRKPQPPLSPSEQERHPWWYNPETQWRGFIESSRYPHLPNEKSEIIDDEEMARLHPDFGYTSVMRPRTGGANDGGAGAGHHADKNGSSRFAHLPVYKRVWQTMLHHPLGPLACRLTVLMTSIVALVLAATIYRRESLSSLGSLASLGQSDGSSASASFYSVWRADRQQERTQVIVAIVVDVVAIPYIGYITADDYTGKPLGLRRPQERIRLLLTDLFFIIFKSASTALGFEAMIFFTTEGSEGLLRALGAFELIGLISWALTLTINIFREIERLVGK